MGRTRAALRQLPDVKLSEEQFTQPVVSGVPQDIVHNESWLSDFIVTVGDSQGWGSGLTPLSPPVITFGTSTSSQNVINWTRPTNGVTSVLQVYISGSWTEIYNGTALTYTHTGLTDSTSYDYRVKAVASGYGDSSWATGTKSTSSSGGDANLMAGYDYLNLGYLTGSGFPTPPLEPTNNTWKITGDGFGQGQPGKRFPVDGNIAFQYQANSANTKMCVGWNAGSLGNYKSIEVEVDGSGVLRVSGPKITENEDFPTQPTDGQFVNLVRISGTGSPSIFEVQIIETDGSTILDSKQYSVADTAVGVSHVEYDSAGGSAVINKPQGKGLTDVA